MKILKKEYLSDNYRNIGGNKNSTRKKIVIGVIITFITLGAFAQNRKAEFKKGEMTPEQFAELQTKKMTLGLELTETQQKDVYNLKKEQAIEHEFKRKERKALYEKGQKQENRNSFERKNKRLDAQLAHQNEMKNILNESQFETWKKSRNHKAHQMKKMRKHKTIKKHVRAKKRQAIRAQDSKE